MVVLLVYQVSVGVMRSRSGASCFQGCRSSLSSLPSAITETAGWIGKRMQALPLMLMVLLLFSLNLLMRDQVYNSQGQVIQAVRNQHNVDVALGIDALTDENASVGVIWAGVIPYYADRKAIDFLGKSDAYIANLPADLSMSLIGHNKFDLQSSICARQPTYIQDFEWDDETLRPWAVKHYVRANYATPYGDITLILKRDDPSVDWEKVTIIPWAEER